MIQIPERNYTDYEQQVLNKICDKINEEFDFFDDEKFRNMPVFEQYMYMGLIRGMNTVLEIVTQENNPETNKIFDNYFQQTDENERGLN